jgi:hypothetical protein
MALIRVLAVILLLIVIIAMYDGIYHFNYVGKYALGLLCREWLYIEIVGAVMILTLWGIAEFSNIYLRLRKLETGRVRPKLFRSEVP